MKNKIPIWTYIISFVNGVVPPFVVIVLGSCYMYTTLDTDTDMVSSSSFLELNYVAVLTGVYLCMTVSLAYYYMVKKRSLRPRWWSNVLLILFGYGIIPLTAMLFGTSDKLEDAISIIPEKFGSALVVFMIGYSLISFIVKKKSESALQVDADGSN